MFIDKRNEYPAESESPAPREKHHAELDYHNRRLRDKKIEIFYASRRVTIISPAVTHSAGDNHF